MITMVAARRVDSTYRTCGVAPFETGPVPRGMAMVGLVEEDYFGSLTGRMGTPLCTPDGGPDDTTIGTGCPRCVVYSPRR
ncbi:MAG: hypothetical protein ABSB35_03600 [Bryobacteraceae bacterium]|jgi:hypothetical protein